MLRAHVEVWWRSYPSLSCVLSSSGLWQPVRPRLHFSASESLPCKTLLFAGVYFDRKHGNTVQFSCRTHYAHYYYLHCGTSV